MKLTPLHLEILLHACCCPAPFPNQTETSGAYSIELCDQGLIELKENDITRFVCTARGTAHVKQILNLPLPQQGWMDAQGKPIE